MKFTQIIQLTILLNHEFTHPWMLKGVPIFTLASSNQPHGWKIPEVNGGVNGKIIHKWCVFQHAMFVYNKDYQRVFDLLGGSVRDHQLLGCASKPPMSSARSGLERSQECKA